MFLQGRVMARTEAEYLGVVPTSARASDEVWLLRSGKVPVVLRRADARKERLFYEVLVEAYVHGVMKGDPWRLGERADMLLK